MRAHPPVRLGLIGAGYIAAVHVRAARGLQDQLRITAVADAYPLAAKALVEEQGHGVAYADTATMLADEQLDGVLIATWPSSHLELMDTCIQAGIKYVLCEKPLALTGAQALAAWRLAADSGAVITEAFMYRHHPALDTVDALLASGALGRIDHVRASFTYMNPAVDHGYAPDDPNRPWRLQSDLGGGALYDIGTYTINACAHVSGSAPLRVAAFGRPPNGYGTSDQTHALVEYANGVIGLLEASEASCSTQELCISGERGTLHLPYAWTIYDETEITIRRTPDPAHVDPDRHFRTLTDRYAVPRSNAFQDQLRHAAAVMRGEASPRVTLAETVVNTLTMEAILRSQAERAVVEVAVPDDVAAAYLGLAAPAAPTDAAAPVAEAQR